MDRCGARGSARFAWGYQKVARDDGSCPWVWLFLWVNLSTTGLLVDEIGESTTDEEQINKMF